MKIVVLQGSPNSKGSTNILVENFIKGSREKGPVVMKDPVYKKTIMKSSKKHSFHQICLF